MLNQTDLAKLLLRITLGVLILLHGLDKLIDGIGPIEALLSRQNLPAFLAWGVYIGEIVAPLMVILGISTRVAAGLIAVNMLFALFLAHLGHLWAINRYGGWAIELEVMYLMAAIAIMLLGPGRWRLHS